MRRLATVLVFIGLKVVEVGGVVFAYYLLSFPGRWADPKMYERHDWLGAGLTGIVLLLLCTLGVVACVALSDWLKWNWRRAREIVERRKKA